MLVIVMFLVVVLVIGLITDMVGITHFGLYDNTRTYQQKQMDVYDAFEKECLSREHSKEQCLIIWSKDDD